MENYEFSLTLHGVNENTPNIDDLLYEAGCDDALVCYYGQAMYLTFNRDAVDYQTAVITAIKDVESAHPDAKVACVDAGDYVGLSDIAELSDVTRASITQLKDGIRGNGGFPYPIQRLQGKRPLWRWSEVAQWLSTQDKIPKALAENARITEFMNVALELRNKKKKQQVEMLVEQLSVA